MGKAPGAVVRVLTAAVLACLVAGCSMARQVVAEVRTLESIGGTHELFWAFFSIDDPKFTLRISHPPHVVVTAKQVTIVDCGGLEVATALPHKDEAVKTTTIYFVEAIAPLTEETCSSVVRARLQWYSRRKPKEIHERDFLLNVEIRD